MPEEPAPPPGPPEGGARLPTNPRATYSVIFGAAAFPFLFVYPFFAFMLAVPSVTCGVYARREIKEAKGAEGGDMTAVVGLTIGATTIALVLLTWLMSPYVTG
jgi:hypothetical protein